MTSMPDELLGSTPAAEPAPPAPDPTDAQIPGDDASLQDHEAAFGAIDPSLSGEAKTDAEATQQRIRHRANKDRARSGDVPRIHELTRKLREAEARAAAAEARATVPPPAAPALPLVPAPSSAVGPERGDSGQPRAATPPATSPKPTEDEIGTKYDSYADFVEALADWKVEQRDAAREAKLAEDRQKTQQETAQREYDTALAKTLERVAAFKLTHPDYETLMAQHSQVNLPPAVNKAVMTSDHGPAFVYHLMQHPDHLTEMQLLFDGKPPSDEFVAHATRWLSSRAQAVITGSAASTPPVTLAARPPNPVRTGPIPTRETLPGDDSSLAEHEHAFGQPRRRAY